MLLSIRKTVNLTIIVYWKKENSLGYSHCWKFVIFDYIEELVYVVSGMLNPNSAGHGFYYPRLAFDLSQYVNLYRIIRWILRTDRIFINS